MKTCTKCNNKHHAKGYCKTHYRELVMNPARQKQICSIEGCDKPVGNNGHNGLCCKHITRVYKNGSPFKVSRNRPYHSLKEFIINTEKNILIDFIFVDRVTWGYAVKLYYGDRCIKCGWNETTCDADHIIPREQGGLNTIQNGQVLCPNCHAVKHRKPPMCQRTGITS